jgi:hypothetical protein
LPESSILVVPAVTTAVKLTPRGELPRTSSARASTRKPRSLRQSAAAWAALFGVEPQAARTTIDSASVARRRIGRGYRC